MKEYNSLCYFRIEKAEEQIKNLTGGNTKMNFAQMHKALTGEEIPDDTDPYDGKLPETKSSCCLLI